MNNLNVERDESGCWVPGSSPNPRGRPRGSVSLASKLKQRLRENPEQADQIVDDVIAKSTGENPDPEYLKLVLEVYGGPVSRIDEDIVEKEKLFDDVLDIAFIVFATTPEQGSKLARLLLKRLDMNTLPSRVGCTVL